MALCDYGYIIESGRIVLHGAAGILGTLSICGRMAGHPAVSSQPTLAPLIVLDVAKAGRSFSYSSAIDETSRHVRKARLIGS